MRKYAILRKGDNYCSDSTLWFSSPASTDCGKIPSIDPPDNIYILSSWNGKATFHVDVTLNCHNLNINMCIEHCLLCNKKLPEEKEGSLFCSSKCIMLYKMRGEE